MHIKQYLIVSLFVICVVSLADTYILMAALQVIVFINIRNHMQVTNRGVIFVELSIG